MLKALISRLFISPAGAHYRQGGKARSREEWATALHHYELAVRLDRGHFAAWNDLGLARCATRDFGGAREAFSRALAIAPESPVASLNIGHLLREEYLEFERAESHYRQALATRSGFVEALIGLGLCLQEQGYVGEATSCYRDALDRDPTSIEAHECLLFALNLLPGQAPEAVFDEHRRWASRIPGNGTLLRPAARIPGARMRVGFVSGDFKAHATAALVFPLLAALDRTRFEVFCYSTTNQRDAYTERFTGLAEHWREVSGRTAVQAAELIRHDGIDVLIDLSGHTRGNRLDVFAQNPAPVAATWLGYLNTTGLAGLRYRITDAQVDPPGASEAFHSETLLRLPDTLWCFEPPADAPALRAPAGERPLTFGSCNHVAKLNAAVLGAWARILQAVPGSRLLVMAVPGERAEARVRKELGSAGIDPQRVETVGRLSRERYWQVLREVDIALDPFPYNGGATTCECLWMHIPVVTLAGRFGFARSSASILSCVERKEWIANDEEQYVAIATGLARDRASLVHSRMSLRDKVLASPLVDAPRFARAFEHALVQACAGV